MFDLLIQNGTVLDGSGKEGFAADVAVKDGKIAAIGNRGADRPCQSCEGKGRYDGCPYPQRIPAAH